MTWNELAEQVEDRFRSPRFSVHMEVERWRDYRGGVELTFTCRVNDRNGDCHEVEAETVDLLAQRIEADLIPQWFGPRVDVAAESARVDAV